MQPPIAEESLSCYHHKAWQVSLLPQGQPAQGVSWDGGCLCQGRAQGGFLCWRPTACTEHKHRNQEENKLQEEKSVR